MHISDPVGTVLLLPVTLHIQIMKAVTVELEERNNEEIQEQEWRSGESARLPVRPDAISGLDSLLALFLL